ncbi:MAG: asparagine synthase-related protein [Thermodesulfobacteriota bacterium]|nr:asparagine synthase-related protein [Thermodesulfobacteriota bacterium]
MRSDVPLGAFLSGGLDSSVIVAAMQDLGEADIHSFAIGFEEASFDESPYAKQVADYLGTVHHESRKALRAGDLLFDLVRRHCVLDQFLLFLLCRILSCVTNVPLSV